MRFRLAVTGTPEVSAGYQTGLRALGGNSTKVTLTDPRLCEGSVDIDSCVRAIYPSENRWDYAIGFNTKIYFIEIHPASTSDIETVIRKLTWLKSWLDAKAPELKKLEPSFHWIATGRVSILPSSKQARKAAQFGIKPKPHLHID